MLILQVILITAIEGLRVQDKADEDIRRKVVWLPPETDNLKVRIITSMFSCYTHTLHINIHINIQMSDFLWAACE